MFWKYVHCKADNTHIHLGYLKLKQLQLFKQFFPL